MLEFLIPDDEAERLAALAEYRVAEGGALPAFQPLLAQAIQLCGASAACLSLVGSEQVQRIARLGIELDSVWRGVSPCAHTILGAGLFCVPDLRGDERFAAHPLLEVQPTLKAYAGLPLFGPQGQPIGTFCVLHGEALSLSLEQGCRLRELAREANRLLDRFHRPAPPLQAGACVDLLRALPDAVLVADAAGSIRELNAEAEELLGYSRQELLGRPLDNLLPALSAPQTTRRPGRDSPAPPRRARRRERECLIHSKQGERHCVELSFLPLQQAEGWVAVILRDVGEELSSQRSLMRISQRSYAKTRDDFFTSLSRDLAEELGADLIIIGRHLRDEGSIETLTCLQKGRLQDNFRYDLIHTPCATTLQQEACVVPHGLRERYPNDHILQKMGLEAYVGVRLYSTRGEVIGLVNVVYERAISPRHAELTLSLLEIVGLRVAAEMERLQAEMKLRTLSLSVDRSPIAVLITDRSAVVEYVNPQFCRMTGYSEAECVGRPASLLASGRTAADTYTAMWRHILTGREWQGELLNRKKSGELYWAQTRIFPLTDEAGRILNFVSIQDDVSQARQLTRRLEYEATHDQLTGLVNRREFERRLERAIQSAGQEGTGHCLCFLDLDRFKVLNDSSGHVAGDQVLKHIGQALRLEIRSHDTAARLGGDEFGLLLMDCPLAKAAEICEKIRAAIRAIRFHWEDRVHTLGTSIGIARISGDINAVELMKQVDAACYSAKDLGRNRIHVYQDDDEFIHRHRRDIDWVPQVTAALAEDRVLLYVQPIVALRDPQCQQGLSYEVLIRLRMPDGRLVAPGQFLPAVQRYNLAAQLDRHVLDKVFAWVESQPEALGELSSLGVNLSPASIGDADLLRYLLEQLRRPGLPAHKLRLEVSEAAVTANVQEARDFMQALREVGAQIALDGFGSGLSSFAFLKNLPVDVLKIDGLLVKAVVADQPGYIMVKMINELAHSLGIRTVAEYVENGTILSCLEELGVDYAQGHCLASPSPIEELSRVLA